MYTKFVPKFVKQYANLADDIKSAVENYNIDVKEGKFPGEEHSF
jgi:3-methyl-2-oxobutanoate hydroxymethyltransferase